MYTFHRNKSANLRLLILGLIGLIGSYQQAISQFQGDQEWGDAKFLLFFFLGSISGWLLYFSGRQMLKSKVALKVDEKGLHDYVSFAEAGLIKWDNIEQVYLGDIQGKQHLIIKYVQGKLPPPGVAMMSEALEAATREAHGNAISISQRNIKEPLSEILARIYEVQPLD